MFNKIVIFAKEVKLKFCLVFCLFSLFFFYPNKPLLSSPLISLYFPTHSIIEHLRLHVPKESKDAWIKAEKASWEPWLKSKKGFLGRELFWDPRKEEATLFISWEDRSTWKSIPQSEIDAVQLLFENIAKEETGKTSGNPFPLIFEGELLPQ